jgi:transposase
MKKTKEVLETISLTEAQDRLGVARNTLWRIIKKYNIATFEDVLDSRVKRVRLKEIQQVLEEAERVRRGIAA